MNASLVRFAAAALLAFASSALLFHVAQGDEPPAPAPKTVVVNHDTSLMVGYNNVAPVAAGQHLNVISTKDGWIGTFVEANGHKTYGWLWGEFADQGDSAIASAPNVRRSYSFEPSENASEPAVVMQPTYPRSRSYSGGSYRGRTSTSSKPLYLLPKGDPRRSGGR